MKHEVIHYIREGARQVSQFKVPEKGSIETLLSSNETVTQGTSGETCHRRMGIPMMLNSREGMFLKRY